MKLGTSSPSRVIDATRHEVGPRNSDTKFGRELGRAYTTGRSGVTSARGEALLRELIAHLVSASIMCPPERKAQRRPKH